MRGDLKVKLRLSQQYHFVAETDVVENKLRCSNLKPGDVVDITIHGEKRSLSANNLFHKWCEVGGEYFQMPGKTKEERKENMKNVFKHMFLGYENIAISEKLVIKEQLRQTRTLGKGEMCHLMDNVSSWCASKGCALPMPADNEYSKWQAEQVA